MSKKSIEILSNTLVSKGIIIQLQGTYLHCNCVQIYYSFMENDSNMCIILNDMHFSRRFIYYVNVKMGYGYSGTNIISFKWL